MRYTVPQTSESSRDTLEPDGPAAYPAWRHTADPEKTRTLGPVHDDPLARMAAATELSDEAVEDLWEKGTRRARCVIAGRTLLPDSVTETILASDDGELLVHWLSAGRDTRHTRRIAAGRRLEIDRALAYQDRLTDEQRDALSWSESAEVLKPLLLREDLTEDQRDRALLRYVSRERILRGSYGEELINVIETAGSPRVGGERRWTRLMEIVGPEQAALVAEAAERGIRDQRVARAAAAALTRLGSSEHVEKNSPVEQDLHRAARLLARAPGLPAGAYEALAELPLFAPVRPQLLERSEIDVAGALELLTCGDDPSRCATGHPAVIAVLSTVIGEVDLPPETLVPAALTHSVELPDGVLDRILGNLHYGARLLEREAALGRLENQVRLVENRQDLYDPATHHSFELVRELARRGSRTLLQRHLPAARREPDGARIVLENYQPVRNLLDDGYYAGLVAERLLTIDGDQREFAHRLLGEWDGSLLELLEAAKTV